MEMVGLWVPGHALAVPAEGCVPGYEAVSVQLGADIAEASADIEPVRRLSLRRGPFFDGAVNERQHRVRNPECLTIVLEQDLETTVNAVGPRDPVTLAELIGVCADGAALDLVPVEAIERFPLVMADPSYDLMFRRSAALAYELGMPATPLAQTAADVRAWDLERGLPALVEGFTEEQEADALQSA